MQIPVILQARVVGQSLQKHLIINVTRGMPQCHLMLSDGFLESSEVLRLQLLLHLVELLLGQLARLGLSKTLGASITTRA
jgi:hypothetical protein